MKNKVLLIGSLVGLAILTSTVLGESLQRASKTPTRFFVVFVEQIGTRSERAMILGSATKPKLSRVRAQLWSDQSLATRLRARGIGLRDIIRIDTASNGARIVYVW